MIDVFARSLAAGRNLGFPTPRDSAVASEVSWAMLHNAVANGPPAVGTTAEMAEILEHRRTLRVGYGLPARPQDVPTNPQVTQSTLAACGEDLCGLAEGAIKSTTRAVGQDAMQG